MIACAISKSDAQVAFQKRESINFSQVKITDKFWNSRINAVTNISIPVCIDQTEFKTGRIRNFEKVAAKKAEIMKVFITMIQMYIKLWKQYRIH